MKDKSYRQEMLLLGCLLAVDLVCALVEAWKVSFQSPNVEYLCQAYDFAAKQRIDSVFLPTGYSGLLGISYIFGGQPGMVAFSMALSLSVILAAWLYLRMLGLSVRATLCLTALLSAYPDFVLSYNKAQETAVTATILFVFLTLLIRSTMAKRLGTLDALLGVTVGYGVLVRPNLALLVLLVWFVFWHLRVAQALRRSVVHVALVLAVYLAGTTAFHGRPYLPHNGPYNLFAGANEFTRFHLDNQEDSIYQALREHGLKAALGHSCSDEKDIDGLPEVHARKMDTTYSRLAWDFIREHPWEMLHLSWLKFKNMMYPDFRIYPPGSVGGVFKIIAALAFPLWLLALVMLPHPGPPTARLCVVVTVAVYIMPFLVMISSPRFRVPLDVLLWLDLGAMLVMWRQRRLAVA